MTRFLLAALLLAGAARAEVTVGATVEVGTFHERLAPYGRWVVTPAYGEVWIPAGVRAGWRPYWDGRWVLTEYGWTFVSDDPWGWAAWHYGHWVFADAYGWVWVPGRVWSPAWVVWRRGGGYLAWAPWGAPRPAWIVVEERHFTEPIARVTVSATFVSRTTVFARPRAPVGAAFAVNPGPHPTVIAAAVGHPITAVQARAVIGHGTAAIAHAPAATMHPMVAQRWERQQQRAERREVRAQHVRPPPRFNGRRRERR